MERQDILFLAFDVVTSGVQSTLVDKEDQVRRIADFNYPIDTNVLPTEQEPITLSWRKDYEEDNYIGCCAY